jgi:hypothetical protein
MRKMLDNGHRIVTQATAILAAEAFMPAELFKTLLYFAQCVPVLKEHAHNGSGEQKFGAK